MLGADLSPSGHVPQLGPLSRSLKPQEKYEVVRGRLFPHSLTAKYLGVTSKDPRRSPAAHFWWARRSPARGTNRS